MSAKPDNVSEICNKLADKHDLNVTVVRDLVEDLRRMVMKQTACPLRSPGKIFGCIDFYDLLKGNWCWSSNHGDYIELYGTLGRFTVRGRRPKLSGGSHKPAAKAARRGK